VGIFPKGFGSDPNADSLEIIFESLDLETSKNIQYIRLIRMKVPYPFLRRPLLLEPVAG